MERNENLESECQERLNSLEKGIQQAQNRESQMIEMSQWMTEVNSLLQSRLVKTFCNKL